SLDFAPSQARLAEKVGVARSAISSWKYGKAYPTPSHLAALARVMNNAHAEAVYERLLDATLRDQGYVPMPEEGGGEHAEHSSAATTEPESGPADQPDTHVRLVPAARKVKGKSAGRRAREEQDQSGEAP